jgi:hypothetical protein
VRTYYDNRVTPNEYHNTVDSHIGSKNLVLAVIWSRNLCGSNAEKSRRRSYEVYRRAGNSPMAVKYRIAVLPDDFTAVSDGESPDIRHTSLGHNTRTGIRTRTTLGASSF